MSQIVRAIDGDNDWTFGAGLGNYRTNLLAVEQNVKTRLQSFLGNCFFDMGAGVNWYLYLGTTGSNNALQCSISLSTILINTQDVTGILQLNFNINPQRSFFISYQVQTVYSQTGSQFQFDFGGGS